MKTLALLMALALSLCASMSAQESAVETSTIYNFQDISYPGDTFTQLLGINNKGIIAGYHNFKKNSGFTLVLPKSFTTENYPGSVQTQVIGINYYDRTVGFYIDQAGITHGFHHVSSLYSKVDFPGSKFNQLLGQNNIGQAVGYYSQSANNSTPDFPYIYDESAGVFEVLYIPGATGGAQATGINDSQQVCGFYIDAKGVNHGFWLNAGNLTKLDFPGSTFTQALGLNNMNEVVGDYVDAQGLTHGFVYNTSTKKWVPVDDPNGIIGTTVVNGTNDKHELVGFWGTNPTNTGFVATLP